MGCLSTHTCHIIGTPIKDKMIHHNLHSIQQVAEMKIQLLQMSEQIESYQQQQQQEQITHYQQRQDTRQQANYQNSPSVRDIVISNVSDNNNNNNEVTVNVSDDDDADDDNNE